MLVISVSLSLQIAGNAQSCIEINDIPDSTLLDYKTIGLGLLGCICCILFLKMEANRLKN
jgi:hypothetical protein